MPISDQIIQAESGGDPNATNPNSSATGPGQFLNSTWMDLVNKYRPDLANGMSQDQVLALRNDPQISAQMTNNYANENGAYLAQKGLPVTPGTTYLAHFAGPAGAAKILGAPPDAPVSAILGQQVIAANPSLKGMTASDLQAWADKKMAPQGAPQAQPLGAPQQPPQQAPQAPQQALGAPMPPVPPQQPGQAPQAQQPQVPMGGGMQMPQGQLSPEMQQLMPIMNAPIRLPPRVNIAQAYSKIPLPAGFQGFNFNRG